MQVYKYVGMKPQISQIFADFFKRTNAREARVARNQGIVLNAELEKNQCFLGRKQRILRIGTPPALGHLPLAGEELLLSVGYDADGVGAVEGAAIF